jgi:hypothetical protein
MNGGPPAFVLRLEDLGVEAEDSAASLCAVALLAVTHDADAVSTILAEDAEAVEPVAHSFDADSLPATGRHADPASVASRREHGRVVDRFRITVGDIAWGRRLRP